MARPVNWFPPYYFHKKSCRSPCVVHRRAPRPTPDRYELLEIGSLQSTLAAEASASPAGSHQRADHPVLSRTTREPHTFQLLPVLCGFHIVCLSVDGNVLSSAIDTIANIAYLALSLVVGSIAFLWGLIRKLWLNQWSAYGTAPENLPA